jgi:DNA-binding response OmpR family regulator
VETAIDAIYEHDFTIYLLGMDLPSGNGLDLLPYIRERSPSAPLIVFSDRADISNIRTAYEAGVDDYVKKPFDPEELVLRLEHLLKLTNPIKMSDLIQIADGYSYSFQREELFYNNRQISLTKVESLLFRALARNIGNVVDTSYLREYVWGDKEVSSSTIRYSVHRLLKKLDDGMIVNHRGMGYSLQKVDRPPN